MAGRGYPLYAYIGDAPTPLPGFFVPDPPPPQAYKREGTTPPPEKGEAGP